MPFTPCRSSTGVRPVSSSAANPMLDGQTLCLQQRSEQDMMTTLMIALVDDCDCCDHDEDGEGYNYNYY